MQTTLQPVVTLFVKVAAKPGSIVKAEKALWDDVIGARTEAGNLKMELYQAKDQPDNFYLIEQWKDQQALEQHFAQPYTAGAFDLQKEDLTGPIEMNYLTDLFPVATSLQKQDHRPLTTLIVPFETKDGERERFAGFFEAFVPLVRQEAGNVEFHFHRINGSDTRFILYERWESQGALDAHNQSPVTAELLENITPLLTKPVIDFVLFATDIS